MHKGQEEARERTAQAIERRQEMERSKRTEIADKVVTALRDAYAARAGEFHVPVIHWDDCNMDCDTFWIHMRAREEDVLQADYNRNIATILRQTQVSIEKEIGKPSPYVLSWERVSSPTKEHYPGKGPPRFRVKGVTQSHWVYKLHINGG